MGDHGKFKKKEQICGNTNGSPNTKIESGKVVD